MQAEVLGTPARRTRKKTELPSEIQAIVDRQKDAAEEAAAKVKETTKEARKLGKVVSLIGELGEWSLDQLGAAIERRRAIISGPQSTMPTQARD